VSLIAATCLPDIAARGRRRIANLLRCGETERLARSDRCKTARNRSRRRFRSGVMEGHPGSTMTRSKISRFALNRSLSFVILFLFRDPLDLCCADSAANHFNYYLKDLCAHRSSGCRRSKGPRCLRDYPQLYGAFMTPSFLRDNGRTLFFVMSQYGPCNTFIMRAQLTYAP
jgi:hypothetical protein